MADDLRLTINYQAMHTIERSTEVLDYLAMLGERIKAAAEENRGQYHPDEPPTYVLYKDIGMHRARVSVATDNAAAKAGEATHHWLLGALDAGR